MSSELHTLIHSLSQSEKRYFKLHAEFMFPSEEKKFMQLFDIILKQTIYNEKKIQAKLDSIYFAQLKQQLSIKILESLRAFHQGNSARSLIDNCLADYRSLLNKNLMNSAAKAIKKAETIAINFELFSELISIKQAETELLVASGDIKKLEKHINELREQMPKWIALIDNFIQIEKTYILFVKRNKETDFIRSVKEQIKLDEFIVAPILSDVTKLKSHRARIHYHYIKGLYYFLSGNLVKSKDAFESQIKEIERNKFIMQNSLTEYAKALANCCLLSNKVGDDIQFSLSYDKLNSIKTTNTLLAKQIVYWMYLLQLNYRISKKEMNEALFWIKSNERLLLTRTSGEEVNKLMVTETNYVMFDTVTAYLHNGHFSKANRLINNYINSTKADIKSDHYSLARIVHLFIQVELGNEDYVQNELKSVELHLKSEKKYYKFEKCCLNFISKLILTNSTKQKLESWKSFHEELISLSKSRFEKNAMMNFDLIYWAEIKSK